MIPFSSVNVPLSCSWTLSAHTERAAEQQDDNGVKRQRIQTADVLCFALFNRYSIYRSVQFKLWQTEHQMVFVMKMFQENFRWFTVSHVLYISCVCFEKKDTGRSICNSIESIERIWTYWHFHTKVVLCANVSTLMPA